jgi:hypothetical protein
MLKLWLAIIKAEIGAEYGGAVIDVRKAVSSG